MLSAIEARCETDGGNALAGRPTDWTAGHPGGKYVRTQIDWPEDDVEFPVEILVCNRSGPQVKLPASVTWTRRSQTIGTSRRRVPVKRLLRKRLRALEVRRTRVRTPVPTRRSATAFRQPRPGAQPRRRRLSRIALIPQRLLDPRIRGLHPGGNQAIMTRLDP
jgi:hypothetical protein